MFLFAFGTLLRGGEHCLKRETTPGARHERAFRRLFDGGVVSLSYASLMR